MDVKDEDYEFDEKKGALHEKWKRKFCLLIIKNQRNYMIVKFIFMFGNIVSSEKNNKTRIKKKK